MVLDIIDYMHISYKFYIYFDAAWPKPTVVAPREIIYLGMHKKKV